MNNCSPLPHICNYSIKELQEKLVELGEPKFRARQIIKWIYQKRVTTFDQMANIGKATREKLKADFSLQKLKICRVLESKSKDAVKFALALNSEGTEIIESVLLYDDDRRTACISSQLGCGLGCVFCQTGTMGFIRNLTQAEILGQLIALNDYCAEKGDKLVTNIVFMGMGEALSNFDNLLSAIRIIMDDDGMAIGGRKINISTAGVVPSIKRLLREDLNLGLAISLNAFNNEQRSRIMPINKHYPIEELIAIAAEYFQKTGRRVTFEYVCIAGVNDTDAAAGALISLLGHQKCKLNLIGLNPTQSTADLKAPTQKQLESFAEKLSAGGLTVMIRASRGQDIAGACGQLAGSTVGT